MSGATGLTGGADGCGLDFSERLYAIKHASERHCVAITDAEGRSVGSLAPIGPEEVRDDALVERMVEWRAEHMQVFTTRFTATFARTRQWLDRIVVGANDRILFKIVRGGELVGHVGLCNVAVDACDVDNLISGRKDTPLEFIIFAELALLRFAFGVLPVGSVAADVLHPNKRAIMLHRLVGFEAAARIPLDRRITETGDEILSPAVDPGSPTSDLRFEHLQISRPRFLQMHREWLASAGGLARFNFEGEAATA